MRSNQLVEHTYNFRKYWDLLFKVPNTQRALLARKRLELRKLLEELNEQARQNSK